MPLEQFLPGWNFWFTLAVLVFVLVGLLQDLIGAEIVMLTGMLALVVTGVLPFKDAAEGFADKSCLAIGALYVVGLGLRSTGALETISRVMFGKPGPTTSRLRLLGPIAALSAFMNNTPLVAFFLPVFVNISRRMRLSPSQLLIPLSYATILGGVCSLIGTSTNIVVAGQMERTPAELGGRALGFFEISKVGIPCAIVGLVYLVTLGAKWLPNRQDLIEYIQTHPREYTIEMLVQPNCPLAGQSVRSGGLRDLEGLYLHRIERSDATINPVGPDELVRAGDLLSFSGVAANIVELQKIRGLLPLDHRTATNLKPPPKPATEVDPLASLDSYEGVSPEPAPVPTSPPSGPALSPAGVASSVKQSSPPPRHSSARPSRTPTFAAATGRPSSPSIARA